MATESIGTARVDVIVNTEQFDTAVQAAKRSVTDMSTVAQQQYAKLDAAEKRRIDRLIHQANTIGFTREQQIAYNAALKTSGPILDEITRKLAQNEARQRAAATAATLSAKQQAAALRGVPAQLTDIFTSLSSGQNPMTVLLQQGGQLKDMFGGIGPAVRALGGSLMGLINPLTLTTAGVAAFVIALEQGRDQAREFEKALILTGNAAGTTTAELAAQAEELDNLTGTTQREAASVLAQVASTGQFTAEQIGLVAQAALQMESATGKAVEDTIAEFVKLKKDPVDAILALNDAQNFLTPAITKTILELKEQGRESEAAAVAIRAYADTINDRAPLVEGNIGLISGAFRGLKNIAADTWDGIVNGIQRADRAALEFLRNHSRAAATGLSLFPGLTALGPIGIQPFITAATAERTSPAGGGRGGRTFDARAEVKLAEERAKWNADGLKYASEREKVETKILEIIAEGNRLGIDRKIIEERVAAVRADFAAKEEKRNRQRKPRQETDPTEAIIARIKQQIALNEEQAKSEDALTASERLRIQVTQQLVELGSKATPQRRAEIEALLAQAVASDKAAQAAKAEAQAKKDLAVLTSQLAAEEEQRRLQNEAELLGIGRGAEAVEALRRQLEIQKELADGLDAIKRDSAGKTAEQLQAEEQALRESIDRRLQMERDYQEKRQALLADWRNGYNAAVEDFTARTDDMAGQAYDFFNNTFEGMSDAVVGFAKGSKDAFDDLLDYWYDAAVRFLADQAISAFLKAIAGGGGGSDSSAAGNYGEAAGSILDLFSGSGFGFARGGYTGDGPESAAAGIVHRGEYVINAKAVRAMGRGSLDQINASRMPAIMPAAMPAWPQVNQVIMVQGKLDNRTAEQVALHSGREIRRSMTRLGG